VLKLKVSVSDQALRWRIFSLVTSTRASEYGSDVLL
jgi:hypothetical protein